LTAVDNVMSSIQKEDREDLKKQKRNEGQTLLEKIKEIKTECSE